MSQSLARVIIHITFSTKRRTPWLRDRAVRNALYEYMGGIEAHHTRMTFQEELRIICRKNGIELDERFAWD